MSCIISLSFLSTVSGFSSMFWMMGENILGVIIRSESWGLILVKFSCVIYGADLDSISEHKVGIRNRLESAYSSSLLDLACYSGFLRSISFISSITAFKTLSTSAIMISSILILMAAASCECFLISCILQCLLVMSPSERISVM